MRSLSFTFFRASFHFVPFPGGERNRQSLVLIQEDKFINCREIYKILTPESVISLCFKVGESFLKNGGNWSGTSLTLHYLKWPGKGCGSF